MSHERLIIIGSGPAGLTAAIYTSRAMLNPLVIEGTQPGGQLMITTDIENFPGFPEGIMGPDLMAKMRQQAERFGTRFRMEMVTSSRLAEKPHTILLGEEELSAVGLEFDGLMTSLHAWYAELWSQHADAMTHWTVDDVAELVRACQEHDPAFWSWLQDRSFQAIQDHRDGIKKKS